MNGKQIIKKSQSNWSEPGLLDRYVSEVCLSKTVGETLRMRETSNNARSCWVATLVSDAIFNMDIGAISQIVQRLDGTIPTTEDRESYANIMGNAIDDVLDYTKADQLTIFPDDPCIIALAKTVVAISTQDCGNNFSKKKEKQQAIEMILQRTGGRKSEPTRVLLTTNYIEPDWMKGLPDSSV